ncbi:MAG: cytochrome c oxidase subunit II [Sphingomonas sp.]|nr:cytochrome c oxidase subunit II [Sphingomonas sp.]
MKTLFKLVAIAAAFGLAPAAIAAAPAPVAAPADAAATANETATEAPAAPEALAPTPGIGQPDGRYGLQDMVTPIGEEAVWFHDIILLPVITVISLFVLALLGWVIVRYRRAANPTPSRNTHNTALEVIWTLVPVLILVVIAVPSIRLLANQYSPPAADITVKAIGNQWYWTYEYPDHGIELVSNMLPDEEAIANGEPRQLAVDERMVVPVGATVKVIVTSNDVIHAWGVPAFWVKIDAVPGRLNETWFRTDREGVYYGVCYELCGARHGYMPIAVEVVSRERFAQWVAARGGTMPGAASAEAASAEAAPAAANDNAVAEAAPAADTNQAIPAN